MWGNDVILGDLVEAVSDDLLEIIEEQGKEGQVQMVKFSNAKEGSQEEKKILTALDLMGEVIAGRCQLKLKENKEANLISEKEYLKVRETEKFGNFLG